MRPVRNLIAVDEEDAKARELAAGEERVARLADNVVASIADAYGVPNVARVLRAP